MYNTKKNTKNISATRTLVYIAVTVALNAICAWVSVPSAIPFTLQTFGIFFSLNFLGGKKGTVAVLLYILIGSLGAPVFSGFKGGLNTFLSPTGGYIFGFALSAFIYLFLTLFSEKTFMKIIACGLGMIACYALGTIWFVFVYGANNNIGFGAALLMCVVPYILPDVAKIALSIFLSQKMRKAFKI